MMARDTLTGSRIRERRIMAGMRQADLARQAGISASYLNLIEHNRRRIGGKLLIGIAQILGVEPSMLTEGAEAALMASLREAAADAKTKVAEVDRVDEFAGRFPGWAGLLVAAHRRIASLERTVETLSDRLTHDPHLATSLHEVLSTTAAIRSTASILAETGELEPEWRDRFHRNLNQDSLRLAESSKALVRYLDESEDSVERRGAPQEEVEAFVAARGHHFPELEDGSADPAALVREASELTTRAARNIARDVLEQYLADARTIPLDAFASALARFGPDPVPLAQEFGADLQAVFRRIAAIPSGVLATSVGLVVCDASGSILFRKPVEGFSVPRFGASCPLWPLFTALSRPLTPIRRRVAQQERSSTAFDCMAVAQPVGALSFDHEPMLRSTMLIVPVVQEPDLQGAQIIGSTCRICARTACPARREPSILREGF